MLSVPAGGRTAALVVLCGWWSAWRSHRTSKNMKGKIKETNLRQIRRIQGTKLILCILLYREKLTRYGVASTVIFFLPSILDRVKKDEVLLRKLNSWVPHFADISACTKAAEGKDSENLAAAFAKFAQKFSKLQKRKVRVYKKLSWALMELAGATESEPTLSSMVPSLRAALTKIQSSIKLKRLGIDRVREMQEFTEAQSEVSDFLKAFMTLDITTRNSVILSVVSRNFQRLCALIPALEDERHSWAKLDATRVSKDLLMIRGKRCTQCQCKEFDGFFFRCGKSNCCVDCFPRWVQRKPRREVQMLAPRLMKLLREERQAAAETIRFGTRRRKNGPSPGGVFYAAARMRAGASRSRQLQSSCQRGLLGRQERVRWRTRWVRGKIRNRQQQYTMRCRRGLGGWMMMPPWKKCRSAASARMMREPNNECFLRSRRFGMREGRKRRGKRRMMMGVEIRRCPTNGCCRWKRWRRQPGKFLRAIFGAGQMARIFVLKEIQRGLTHRRLSLECRIEKLRYLEKFLRKMKNSGRCLPPPNSPARRQRMSEESKRLSEKCQRVAKLLDDLNAKTGMSS